MLINIFLRYFYLYKLRRKNKTKDISIISNNCIGGCLYHDLGLKFLSPTINLFFYPNDYLKLAENLNFYMSIDLADMGYSEKWQCPVGYLCKDTEKQIKIYFLHYKTNEKCIAKWNERRKRINYNNILLINTNQSEITNETIDRFLKIK